MATKLKWVVPVIVVVLVAAALVVAGIVMLAPDKGILSLECKKAIDLEIDGTSYGNGTEFSIPLTIGSHEYKGLMHGVADSKMELKGTFSISKGEVTKVICGTEPVVSFTSNPKGAQVSVASDISQPLGKTPVDVHLPPGVYTFILNLDGQAKKYGPIDLAFDEKKKVEVFFGKTPKTGSIQGDSVNITSIPEGIQIYRGDELVGITPVSFADAKNLTAKVGGDMVSIPLIFKRQNVWLHPGAKLSMIVTASNIESSAHEWFANGGYFNSYIQDGFLKVTDNSGHTIQAKLPPHDTILDLTLYGGTLVFSGMKKDALIIAGYEAQTLKQMEVKDSRMFVAEFARQIQSQDGSTTRYFSIVDNTLCEFDTENMKVFKLGKVQQGLHFRRMGETSDFGVGLFNADGTCVGVYGRRYAWNLDGSWQVGGVKNVQPAIICFFKGTDIVGFNTGSGEAEWQTKIAEEPLSISWNENEQVWIAESLNSENHYLIDPNSGTSTPLDKNNTFVQPNPNPGFRGLGFISTQDKMCQIFYNPSGILKCFVDGVELWSLNCEQLYSTKAFNPLLDLGQIIIKKTNGCYVVDPSSGSINLLSESQPLQFFENGAVMFPEGIWSGPNRIFEGSGTVSQRGNALRIVLNDEASCVILP